MITDFGSSLPNMDINNVFIYVGDAVRYDYLPDAFSDRGAVFKTVAASTHSPTSFASLVTGHNPFTHGVSSFKNRIRDDVFSLFDIEGYHTQFVNSILYEGHQDPIFSVFGIDQPSSSEDLLDVPSPFIIMERGQGGHAPYNPEYPTAREYFRSVSKDRVDTIQRDYQNAIKRDEEIFLDRLEELEVDDDTLVIYTSDHGELLGEGGMLGHTSPMRPELVYVPTVFFHSELPTGVSSDTLFRHVDLLPTILDILGYSTPEDGTRAGRSLVSDQHVEYGISRYNHTFFSFDMPRLSGQMHYEGVWNHDGGFVFARSSLFDRLSFLIGKLINSDKRVFLKRNLTSVIRSYSKGRTVYGSPSISRQTAVDQLKSNQHQPDSTKEYELSDSDLDNLRDLGYL